MFHPVDHYLERGWVGTDRRRPGRPPRRADAAVVLHRRLRGARARRVRARRGAAARAGPAPAGRARLLRVRAARGHRALRSAASRFRRSGTSSRSSTSRTRRRSYGPDREVPYPDGTKELDYELEVAAVIGADQQIAGFTVMNDWSARDLQRAEMKVGLGPAKGKDFATSHRPDRRHRRRVPRRRSGDGRARERRGALPRQPARPLLLLGADPRRTRRATRRCARATCSAPAPSARAAPRAQSLVGLGRPVAAARRRRRARGRGDRSPRNTIASLPGQAPLWMRSDPDRPVRAVRLARRLRDACYRGRRPAAPHSSSGAHRSRDAGARRVRRIDDGRIDEYEEPRGELAERRRVLDLRPTVHRGGAMFEVQVKQVPEVSYVSRRDSIEIAYDASSPARRRSRLTTPVEVCVRTAEPRRAEVRMRSTERARLGAYDASPAGSSSAPRARDARSTSDPSREEPRMEIAWPIR